MNLKLFHSRDKPKNSVSSAPTFYFGHTDSGKTVTPRTAVQLPIVYACVRVLAETVASLPFGVYREIPTGGSEKATDHPLYRILHDAPNDEMTSFSWRETMMTHLLLWGNSYNQILRNRKGEVIGLYPLQPQSMTVDRNSRGELTYTYLKDDGTSVTLTPWEVLHIPGLGFDGIMGYSPITMARNAIGLALAAEEHGSKTFANGAVPSGVLTHPNTVKDPKKLRDAWQAAYGGSGNSGKVAVLEEGMSYTPISLSNADAQFLETRKFEVEEICRIFRVPPHLVCDLSHATFSNIEHQGIEFAQHSIRPWLVRIEQSVNRSLFTRADAGMYSSINIDGLMRGSYRERMEGYRIAVQSGIFSVNDVLNLENMNPISDEEGGNLHLVNGTMTKLAYAGVAYKQGTTDAVAEEVKKDE